MFSLTHISRTTQHLVCMTLAALIVAASLSIGAYGTYAAADREYSITITQM